MANLDKYERQHRQYLAGIERQVLAIYETAAREAASIGMSVGDLTDDLFTFDRYPITHERIGRLMQQLHDRLEAVVVDGVNSGWTLANNKNNELVRRVYGSSLNSLTLEQQRRYFSNREDAREAFLARKVQGLSLSDRVWRYTDLYKREIELGLDVGLRAGTSADELSRELRSYLKFPDKLFRRVRDQHGNLVLSQAAKAFHPGQGVYRSSYMNARRLAATETNIAYRTADYERIKDLDFVVGIEVHLSSNHTCKGVEGVFRDICDELQGKYPKDFKFTGWHPHCRCYTTTILKTPAELEADEQRILRGEEPSEGSENEVQDVPKAFDDWVSNNQERVARAKSMPYFLRDNGVLSTEGYSLKVGMTEIGNTSYVNSETPILSSNSESMAYMQQLLNVGDAEATKYLDAIEYFVGNGYVKVREFQQGKDIGDEVAKRVEPISNNLERLIIISPKYEGVTYRGLSVNNTILRRFVDLADNGGILSMDGTSSWSTDEMTAKYFASGDGKRVIFRCNGKQMGTSIRAYAANPHEHEILVSRKAKWKITGYKTIHGAHYFDVVLM